MKVVAKDRDGIPRVWGEGSTTDEAIHNCHTALEEYFEDKASKGVTRGMYIGNYTFELSDGNEDLELARQFLGCVHKEIKKHIKTA